MEFQKMEDERGLDQREGQRGGPQCVAWFPLYRTKLCNQIRTQLRGKIANKEKNFDNVSGPLFFGQKKKV